MSGSRCYNILVINWQDITHPMGGGAEVHLHEIFKRVAAQGHGVTLLCCHYPGALREQILDGMRIVRRGHRSLFNFCVPMAFRDLTGKQHFDIILDDLNKIPFFTPLFVKVPLLAIVHHFFGSSIFRQTNVFGGLYVYLAEKTVPFIYRRTPFVTVSQSTATELRNSGIRSFIQLVPNAVDHSQYRVDKSLASPFPLIGYLGRLKKYKCVEHVIQVLPLVLTKVHDARLVIVGEGDDRPRLQRLTQRMGLQDRVTFTGAVSHEDKVRYLNQFWLAVNPSPKEGWGLTVIEANACGLPVIAADSPGLRDSVVDGETGLLYPFGKITVLADRIVQVLRNPTLRDRLSERALTWASQFRWDDSANKLVQVIKSLLEAKQLWRSQ